MDQEADGRARAELRKISRGLTGKGDFRLEVALAVEQLGKESFTVTEVSALLPPDAGRSDNTARNLQALVAAGFLQQTMPGGPYQRDHRLPFWTFLHETWCILLAQAHSAEKGENAIAALAEARDAARKFAAHAE